MEKRLESTLDKNLKDMTREELIKELEKLRKHNKELKDRETEHKKKEEALRESEERYRSLVEKNPAGIVVHSEGRVVYINETCLKRMNAASEEEILGMSVLDFVHPDYRKTVVERVKRIHESGKEVESIEEKFLTQDGKVWDVEVMGMPISYKGKPAVPVVIWDISDRKKLEEELFQSRKMESIGRLAGGVAHDFNNMLTPIIGYTEMLLLDISQQDPHYDDVIQIRKAAERARNITRKLLSFSRKQMLDMRVHNLGKVVLGFENILRCTIREDIDLEISIAPSLGNIKTDASQIEQIFLNLSVNAQDAMPNGGKLIIEIDNVVLDKDFSREHPEMEEGEYVMLSVSDTGYGMDSCTLGQIFEPFFTTREDGTGLGLATVYGIVKQHDGSIRVNSEPDRGTTFKIYFPKVDEELTQDLVIPEAEVDSRKGETILVVEDEEAVRKLASRILKRHGYRVISAGSGEEAINAIGEYSEPIHLLLTDVIMPKIDGKELFRRISSARSSVKVLYMSGYTQDVIAHHGIMEEGTHFIQKPFSAQTLIEKVRKVLDE